MPRPAPFAVPGYHLDAPIGEGTAGKVYAARPSADHTRNPAARFAVKIIPRAKVGDAVRREVGLHIALRHPHIARLHCALPATPAFQAPPSPRDVHVPAPAALALVMEHAAAGDMFTEVASAGCLPPRLVRRRLRDIASALQYLHDNRIAHLDVKLENVVISNSSAAKLIDFGCARHLDAPESGQTVLGGTLHYLPPEVVANQDCLPATSSDAWALGVLAYTALAGNYPFNGSRSAEEDDEATRHRILHCPPHRFHRGIEVPSDLAHIVQGLLEKEPKKRMTIPQVIAELDRTPDRVPSAISRQSRKVVSEPPEAHANCPIRRPRSPSGTSDAEFCDCDSKQSRKEALQIVDAIQRNRIRAAQGVQRFLSDMERSTEKKRNVATKKSNSSVTRACFDDRTV